MLWTSGNFPKREGYIYTPAPGGGMIAWSANARPFINRKHIDGPLLVMRNGELHWLTLWERVLLRFGGSDALRLERKYRPLLAGPADCHAEAERLAP